jgi:ABC-type glycerol-3-phosphate transport system permease component
MKSLIICTSHLIIMVIKSKSDINRIYSIWWEMRNAYKILDMKHERKSPHERRRLLPDFVASQPREQYCPSRLHGITLQKAVLFLVITVSMWNPAFRYSSEDSKLSVQLHHSWFNDLMLTVGEEEYRVWNSLFFSLVTNILHILFSSIIGFIFKYPTNKNVLDWD